MMCAAESSRKHWIIGGKKGDPLYQARRTLHTGCEFLTEKQQKRIAELFTNPDHADVEVTWSVYQDIMSAYRNPDRTVGKRMLESVIASISSGVPAGLIELRKLGRTLKKRVGDVVAYFDRPGTSNGPTEALNGRLEHLWGSALGFRNLTHYIARSLLEAGGFRPRLHP